MVKKQEDRSVPVIVFYSYAHEDESLRDELEKHLSLLHRQGTITAWHDRQIMPGTDWHGEIDQHLDMASLILLLISPDFLASDYCYTVEMQRALERHKQGKARVIPVILRPVDWHEAPFAHLQCLPRDGKPVTEWDNRDAAFRDIAKGIRNTYIQNGNTPFTFSLHQQNLWRLRLHQLFVPRRNHIAKPLFYIIIGVILLSILILLRPLWYATLFASSKPGVHSSSTLTPLEIPFVIPQSKFWVIPGNVAQYSLQAPPPEQIGALPADAHISAPLYYLYLNLHNSSAMSTKLIIEEVDLVILQVRPMSHPVPLWTEGEALTYTSTHKYEALYTGQVSGTILADHVDTDYLTHNSGIILLSPGETDTIEIHVVSRSEADLLFSVQVIYHFSTEQQHHILKLPNTFEVMFVDTTDWRVYQYKDGHFISNP